jgi:hypothetical protein
MPSSQEPARGDELHFATRCFICADLLAPARPLQAG